VTRGLAWSGLALAVAAAERASAGAAPAARMLVLIAALFLALKLVASRESGVRLPRGRWLAFVLLWPGMDPSPFAVRHAGPLPVARATVVRALMQVAAGVALALGARMLFAAGAHGMAGAVALGAFSSLVHFGVFPLVECAWRRAGFDVPVLFDRPLTARSLDEFWSRRWNLAFSRMTALVVYRPLARGAGRGAALAGAFLFSGAAHELAISVPVNAGLGLPTLYFALHGALVWLERRAARAGRPVASRAWTAFWVLAPVPLVFHPAFVAGVVWPWL
jgi:hypothetical protein